MKISRYFTNLAQSYLEEIDDLVTDSEGKSVLQRRLKDKRGEMDALLAMIDYSPEMVAVIFYDAFGFQSAEVMQRLLQSEPELGDFLKWDVLRKSLSIAPWAEPLIATTLKVAGGDAFLVTAATLEFVRTKAAFTASKSEAADESGGDDDDSEDEADDLGDAGSDWLVEQGFDTREE
ncbi:hypothetical protein [Thiobacillus sp.]|uniref:hypothetical protein n=1 Tax=Thiobacillus sp. TaxID=924 RepID=UPI0025E2CDC8|nr:hypothetical protein [Thiobacillus sp.]MBT9539155.1 hypothetical protein [Thiobacillus sp.]